MAETVIRKPHGSGFTYRHADGQTVTSRPLRTWIKTLAIPPAWRDVEICVDRDARLHAWGRDQKGRKQYIYNPSWSEERSEQKFQRIVRFGNQLQSMRRVTGQHIRRRPIDRLTVLACMTRMLDEAFFRPGNPAYTRDHETFGLTTLRDRHMHMRQGAVEFDYLGKSHQQQHREVHDTQVRNVLRELEKMQGRELFDITLPDGERKKITAQDLNSYIAEVMGEDFSAKDFRTWAGTVLMAVALDKLGATEDHKLSRSNIVAAIKDVAGKLGNTPAVCRANYVHPGVILQYESGRTLDYVRRELKLRKGRYITIDERATLELLDQLVEKEQVK